MRTHPALFLLAFSVAACSAGQDRDVTPGGFADVGVDSTVTEDTQPTFDVILDSPKMDVINPDAGCATSSAEAIKPAVDIIVAIDQSGSMSEEIAKVKTNINKMSDFLKTTGFDYRVVMIARPGTDTFGVCIPPPLGGPTCGDNPPTYRRSAQEVQSNDALGLILSTYDSTNDLVKWSGSLRPDATKIFVVITDDDARQPLPAPYWQTFDTEILKRGSGTFGTADKRKYVFFPICGASETDATVKCGTGMVNTGSQYIELTKLTGGKWYPLCAVDFGPLFLDMGKKIAGKVACELTVPKPPTGETIDPSKVNVSYTPSTGGSAKELLQDSSKPCDGGANGWQFNADKTKILLCGDACKVVQGDPGTKVNVVFGCKTKVE
jgi:hypothetical protein